MEINKHTLFIMNDITNYAQNHMEILYDLLPLLNISNDERALIETAINTVECKVQEIKHSKVSELENHFNDHISYL